MGQLKYFKDFADKQKYFSNTDNFRIDTKKQFDKWFDFYTSEIKEGKKTDYIYRGMKDAHHKLYTSTQRIWLQNDMSEWVNDGYFGFIDRMIQKAKDYPLIKKVFDIYGYSDEQREFPILSILQHYWAISPLMDWSYNINVALFFATETINGGNGNSDLKDYFSIYLINKSKYRHELLNLADFDGGLDMKFSKFKDWGEINGEADKNKNGIFYISDFESGNVHGTIPYPNIQLRTERPFTSIYNQNIIPQEGLFIFNPFSTKTLEEIFNIDLTTEEGWNLALTKFSCFNIKKDLGDYVRRRIKNRYHIDKAFIYPHLYDDMNTIKNSALDYYGR